MTVIRRDVAKIAACVAAGLQQAKTEAIAAVNAVSGLTRQKFITILPGQNMIYMAKEREAIANLAAPTGDSTPYPLLAAEVGVTAPTAWELAQVWVNVSVYWRSIAARIEGVQMCAIAQIENCTDPDDLNAIVATFRPLQGGL